MNKESQISQLPQLLTTAQAARYLNLRPGTLNTWRSLGKGPKFQKFGRAVRYSIETLREWVEEHTRTNTTFRGQQSY